MTVNSAAVDYRRGEFYQKTLSVGNATAPTWQSVSASAGGTAATGSILSSPTNQVFLYDADGNMTNDCVSAYIYDAENRLTQIQNLTTLATTTVRKQLKFEYDAQGRRVRKRVFPWGATDYSTTASSDERFVYDGWNVIAMFDGTSTTAKNTFMWGLDLSGTEQGAGGVGGLLKTTTTLSPSGTYLAEYDGNGNVMGLVSGSSGANVGGYEYGPFGELLRISGAAAGNNPLRFSTKYHDMQTELAYYGYRYYAPGVGRWINRDPGEESVNAAGLYAFVGNNCIGGSDVLGLYDIDFHYYAVYFLLRSRCFPAPIADQIAYQSQAIDDTSLTNPLILGAAVQAGASWAAGLLEMFHFTGSTPHSPTSMGNGEALLRSALTSVASFPVDDNNYNVGRLLHAYADTFSHDGFTAWKSKTVNDYGRRIAHPRTVVEWAINNSFVGHANLAHDPDLPFTNPYKATLATWRIFDLLPSYCACGSTFQSITGDVFSQFHVSGSESTRVDGWKRLIKSKFGDHADYNRMHVTLDDPSIIYY